MCFDINWKTYRPIVVCMRYCIQGSVHGPAPPLWTDDRVMCCQSWSYFQQWIRPSTSWSGKGRSQILIFLEFWFVRTLTFSYRVVPKVIPLFNTVCLLLCEHSKSRSRSLMCFPIPEGDPCVYPSLYAQFSSARLSKWLQSYMLCFIRIYTVPMHRIAIL